jgi:hypothetical protein
MKKNIFILFIAVLAFISCNKHDFEYNPNQIITDNYNTAFVKTFGVPDESHMWGFSKVTSTRSSYPNSNEWSSKGYKVPGTISDSEINNVKAVFDTKGKESYTSLVDWDCFFVQQVWKGTASYTAGNGGTVIGGNQMDWLCAYDPSNNTDDHVNNFNNSNGSIMLMVNSSTSRFGFKSSTDNGHVFYNFRMEKINGNYYVGFDFEANGQNPNEQVKRDYIYNDWIVKIVPGTGANPPSDKLRIIAEDLSASSGTDFDFNDIVIDVEIKNGNAYCELIAAGGTLPLRINGDDNLEVHKMFGVETNVMVNTGAGLNKEAIPFTLNGITDASNIKLEVDKGNGWVEMTANQGVPAAKIAVRQDFDICGEREAITTKYPNFKNWVQNQDYIWW